MKRLLLLLALITPAFADDLADLRTEFDKIEQSLSRSFVSNDELTVLKNKLEPLATKISDSIRKIEPQLEEAKERLASLTPPKAEEGKPAPPPETDEVKREREKQAKTVAEIDANLKQYNALAVRSEQDLQKITDHKRRLFTAQLFETSPSVLSPTLWGEVGDNLPYTARSTVYLFNEQFSSLMPTQLALVTVLIALMIGFWYFLRKALISSLFLNRFQSEDIASLRIGALFIIFFQKSLPFFISILAFTLIGDLLGLFVPRIKPLLQALLIAAGLTSVMKGLCHAVIARKSSLRLVLLNDDAAFALVTLVRAIARIVATTMVLLALLKILYAPLNLTVFTAQIMSLCVIISIFRFLMSDKAEDLGNLAFLRPLLWIMSLTLIASLVTGYSAFSSYLITRAVLTAIVLMVGRLLFALLSALIADLFMQTGKHGLSIAKALGIAPIKLELTGMVLKGALQLFLILLGIMTILGPWGLQTGDYSARLDDSVLGLRLGDVRHSIWIVLGAITIFILGIMVTRALRGWLRDEILPRTSTDTGLQNSFSTILSYAGFVAAFFAGLNFLGVSLGSVTILAGALSVGIGFGLQSIVSNFVSGLILLAERPIRVGDSINVKGEEGRVRKISVRSTEIETFERSTVIIPNSELISGVVKNWTHSNRQARISIAVRVAYDSDVDLVMSELLLAAKSVKTIQKDPPPKVYLSHLKDNGLEFELRIVIINVDHILSAKSDVNLAVLKRLNAAGIIIAPPEQRVQTKKPDNA